MSESQNKALLLIGSPKGEKSTSASLGNYLASKLEELGMIIEKGHINRLVNRQESILKLLSMVKNADLIILSFPLYVDSIPAPVIKSMELIKDEYDKNRVSKSQDLIVISNCGFPESLQISVAINICELFAKSTGFSWKGGVAIGGGGAINGLPLEERGGMVRNIIEGLNIAAKALVNGNEIPQNAIDLMSKNFIPTRLYRMMGNLGWRLQSRRYKNREKLRATPYSP